MKKLAIAAGSLCICIAFPAAAQPQTQGGVTWDVEWWSVTPMGPASAPWQSVTLSKGEVRPGDGVLLQVAFNLWLEPGKFEPFCGGCILTPLTWNPQVLAGSSGAGGLGGLWSGNINITPSGGDASGAWSDNSQAFDPAVRFRLIAPYVLPNSAGVGHANGSVENIQPGQFGPDANLLDHSKQKTVWSGMWIPDSYAPRSITFTPTIGSLGFLSQVYAIDSNYEFGYTLPVPLNVQTEFGPGVTVMIIPAPGIMAPLALAAFALVPRPRR